MIGDRIRQRRIEIGMTQEELAKRTGYKSRSTINRIEKNERDIQIEKVGDFASALRVSPSYIMGWDDTQETATAIKVPVLGDVAAGVPMDAIENIIDYEEVPERFAQVGEFFALRIHGDSMEPRICEGDIVIVKCQPDAESGDVCIVTIGNDKATCKKIRKTEEGSIALISFNPNYEPMIYTPQQIEGEPVAILGVVVENRQKYKRI